MKDWFTVNAGFQEPNLHPIPIGIASSFSLKNLVANDFLDFREDNFKKDKVSLYINFQKNTNFKERNNLADEFGDKEWINIDVPNLDKDTYMKKVEESFHKIITFYDKIFFLSPDFPLEDDGVRSTDEQWREEIHDMFLQEIEAGKVDVIPISGSVTERVTQIYERMDGK